MICKRLIGHYGPLELFRLNSWQRVSGSVVPEILPYCFQTPRGDFDLPPSETLSLKKIIISTCGSAGSLRHLVPFFDVVIVDEASQVVEAEVLIPLSLVHDFGACIISGDTEQLSNSPRSPLFSESAQCNSLQERLLHLPFYEDIKLQHSHRYDHFVFGSFLRRNYRSHKDIFGVSSRLFYDNALVEAGNKVVTNSLIGWNVQGAFKDQIYLSRKALNTTEKVEINVSECETRMASAQNGSPIHFVGINGIHAHELDSPSYYNEMEIAAVVQLCKDLTTDVKIAVTEMDIGIIAAFRSQVLKIRLSLRKAGLGKVNVGSVQDFQGQEMKVIIISTVLTSGMRVTREADIWIEKIGLFADYRKFNVAVTRGMALCIVVGDPYALYADEYWRVYLEECDEKGRYSGYDCRLLNRYSKQLEEKDATDLLNAAVHYALRQDMVLGGGIGVGVGGVGRNDHNSSSARLLAEYGVYSDEITWRTLL